jgi:hypothetical protein
MITYPPLRLAMLNGLIGLKERMIVQPEVLRAVDCPYDAETVDLLERIMEVKEVERIIEKTVTVNKQDVGRPRKIGGLSADDMARLNEEVMGLFDGLKNMVVDEAGLETSERLQILKARASLIEQALKNQERILNLKSMSEFQTVVINILDDLMSEDSREEFLNRIEPYRE